MRNGASFNESVTFAQRSNGQYKYRNQMGMVPSFEYCTFFEDFIKAVATNVPNGWSAAIIDTGATLTYSQTAGSLGATGGALIASDGTSEGVAVYLNSMQLTVGKRFWMEVRVQTSIAAETDVQFGLSSCNATTNPEDLWTTTSTDVVAFGTLAGSATPKMLSDKSNSGSTVETGTIAIANATYANLAISYDGGVNLTGWVNGQMSLLWSQASTTIPTGVALAPFFGARTGATAGNITTFDYVRYCIER